MVKRGKRPSDWRLSCIMVSSRTPYIIYLTLYWSLLTLSLTLQLYQVTLIHSVFILFMFISLMGTLAIFYLHAFINIWNMMYDPTLTVWNIKWQFNSFIHTITVSMQVLPLKVYWLWSKPTNQVEPSKFVCRIIYLFFKILPIYDPELHMILIFLFVAYGWIMWCFCKGFLKRLWLSDSISSPYI